MNQGHHFHASTSLRLSLLVAILFAVTPLGGCRICSDCEDADYSAYGGAWQRTLRDRGRVGSVFDPGGAKVSSLVDRDAPESQTEIERKRQGERDSDDDTPERDEETPEENDNEPSDDDEADSLQDKAKELRDKELDDIEGDREDELRKKGLDDIEVRIIKGKPPVMVNTNE